MAKKKAAKHINIAHARTDFQRDVMKRIKKDGVCPFCMEHFLKYHTKPILLRGRYWVITQNFEPYAGSKAHLIAIYKKHTEHFDSVPPKALAELFSGFKKLATRRKVRGGTLFMRFGDTDYTGATVAHLHVQLVSGVSRKRSRTPLVTRIGYQAPAVRPRKVRKIQEKK